jgi:polyferredoxin
LFEDILSGSKLRDALISGQCRSNVIEARLDGRERAPYAEGGWLVMTRQQLRKTLLALGLLLFQIKLLHMFLSPVLPVVGASRGIVCASLMAYGLLFLSSILLGRAFCGWFCPGAAVQEVCSLTIHRRAKGGWRNWIKYGVCGAWAGAVLLAAIHAGGFHRIDLLFGTQSWKPGRDLLLRFGAYVLIVPMSAALGRWASCHYLCWIAPLLILGTRIGDWSGWRALQLRPSPEACGDCGVCTEHCPMSLDVGAMVRSGVMRNDECVLCGNCADLCPTQAIRLTFSGSA